MIEYSTEVSGQVKMLKDELNKAYMELGKKLDREKDDYSTKEVIKPLIYSGVGLLPTLRHTFDLQFQLEFTLYRKTKGSSILSWSDCEEGSRVLWISEEAVIHVIWSSGKGSLVGIPTRSGSGIGSLMLAIGSDLPWLEFQSKKAFHFVLEDINEISN
ncbi:hypothetical protein K435DRAFT_799280 [Dendrothele bispora CBS 962.96]|uniref:Uncharacterized protein n=1 Tax=Dendrothele bispora (strain CBS 962.96) TaxID=1314807 RepID=A0A4S8LXL9_DENBC|nr:hypothetical protein K435DRAFT_799280 [Dendrothele bispora CBS 962.96]